MSKHSLTAIHYFKPLQPCITLMTLTPSLFLSHHLLSASQLQQTTSNPPLPFSIDSEAPETVSDQMIEIDETVLHVYYSMPKLTTCYPLNSLIKESTTGNVALSSDPTSQDNQPHSITEVLPFTVMIAASILVNPEIPITHHLNPAPHHPSINLNHASHSKVKTMHSGCCMKPDTSCLYGMPHHLTCLLTQMVHLNMILVLLDTPQ